MEEALSCIGKMPIFSGIREEELYTLIKCCDGQMAVFEKEVPKESFEVFDILNKMCVDCMRKV